MLLKCYAVTPRIFPFYCKPKGILKIESLTPQVSSGSFKAKTAQVVNRKTCRIEKHRLQE